MASPDRDKSTNDHFNSETVRSYSDGEVIFTEGENSRDLYVIQQGAVEIRKKTASGDIPLARFGRGHFFGELSLVHSLPRSATAVSVGETRLLVLQAGGFLLKIRRDPTFAFEMIQQLSHRVKVSNDRLVGLLEKSPSTQEEILQILRESESAAK
jgi:CRP/FNR family transcriptional regulator, cyclic AMP receptor protein